MSTASNPYESGKLLSEYLFFHYASPAAFAGGLPVPEEALDFPVRVVSELLDPARATGRALDVGCAVGRSSFELAKTFQRVVGVDFSDGFISAAKSMQATGEAACEVAEEGRRMREVVVRAPDGVGRARVDFEVGDAMALRADLGGFDLVLAANLICRLPDPRKFIARLPDLVLPGGQLLLATPFSWLEEYTAEDHWLGGRPAGPTSFEALSSLLEPHFELQEKRELPFLIREHARKFQYVISLGTRWVRS